MWNLIWNKNQPTSSYGTHMDPIDVEEYLNKKCWLPNINITAFQRKELSELAMFGFDVVENTFKGKGKLELNVYWPEFILPNKTLKEKNIFKIYDAKTLDFNKDGSITVTEFANDGSQISAVSDIVWSLSGIFSDVTWLQANDQVLTIKWSPTSNTIKAKVKITDVDKITKEITFDTPVTIDAWDSIQYITTDTFGCKINTKTIGASSEEGKSFKYNLQKFSRKVKIFNEEFEQTMNNIQQVNYFQYKYFGQPIQEMQLELARQLRLGGWEGWASPKIKGYDSIIEERNAAGIESIYDFAGLTTAKQYKDKMANELFKLHRAPVDSKFVFVANYAFHRAYKNMLERLQASDATLATCVLKDSLYDGIKKWDLPEAEMIDAYVSETLSKEEPYTGVAYILPIDLIAAFTGKYSDIELRWGNIKKENTVFGSVKTFEIQWERTAECRTYEHFMKAGILFGGVSFRDTYKRFDNFNFEL